MALLTLLAFLVPAFSPAASFVRGLEASSSLANRNVALPRPERPFTDHKDVASKVGEGSVKFEVNRGQTDPAVKFLARAPGYSALFSSSEAVLRFPHLGGNAAAATDKSTTEVRIRPIGSNPNPKVEGNKPLKGSTNYLMGNDPSKWITGVPTYSQVAYKDVYPGTDMVYYANPKGALEYDFIVTPGADPSKIGLELDGAGSMRLGPKGDLLLETGGGSLVQPEPKIFQTINGKRYVVSGGYVIKGERQVGFQIGGYDKTKTLTIDPVISYSTLLGGSGADKPAGIAVDAAGSAYITGTTTSIDFPATSNAFKKACGSDGKCNPQLPTDPIDPVTRLCPPVTVKALGLCNKMAAPLQSDVFVTKLAPNGSAVEYSTYLGGSGPDEGVSIAVDKAGSAYVAGRTKSPDFPTTVNAVDRTCGTAATANCDLLTDPKGGHSSQTKADLFVTKLSPSGGALNYSTYFGGSGDDGRAGSVSYAADTSGNPTFEERSNYNGTESGPGNYQGSDPPAVAIALGDNGQIYLTGATLSADFPTTAGALDSSCGSDGRCDQKNFWEYCSSLEPNCPRYVDPKHPSNDGAYVLIQADAFLARIDPDAKPGTLPSYLTYLGGRRADAAFDIALWKDQAGRQFVYLTGMTQSPGSSSPADRFPTTDSKAFQARPKGDKDGNDDPRADTEPDVARSESDAFLMRIDLSKAGQDSLDYSSLLGGGVANNTGRPPGSGEDTAYALAVDSLGAAFITGRTNSFSLTTKGVRGSRPLQVKKSAVVGENESSNSEIGFDAFVAEVDPALSGETSLIFSTYLGGPSREPAIASKTRAASESGNAVGVDAAGNIYVAGQTTSTSFPTTTNAYQGPGSGAGCEPVGGQSSAVGQCPDGFFATLNFEPGAGGAPSAPNPIYSTYLRSDGEGQDGVQAMATWSDPATGAPYAYLAGRTNGAGFPVTSGVAQSAPRGDYDGFVTKFGDAGTPVPFVESVDPATSLGPLAGGTSVGLIGRQLQRVDSVKFGRDAVACPSVRCSKNTTGTQITVTSPPHGTPETVDLTVTSGSFTSPPNPAVQFTYYDPGAPPRLLAISPSAGPSSGGTEVAVSGEGLSRLEFVKFGEKTLSCPSTDCRVDAIGRNVLVRSPYHLPGAVAFHMGSKGADFPEQHEFSFQFYSGAWAPAEAAPVARSNHAALVLGGPACGNEGSGPEYCGRVLVLGGVSPESTQDPTLEERRLIQRRSVQLYDPRSGTWSKLDCSRGPLCPGPLIEPRSDGFSATALKDGRILVAGGHAQYAGRKGGDTTAKSIEIYDPATGAWTGSCPAQSVSAACPGQMSFDRVKHTATLLPSGKVVVTGGSSAGLDASGGVVDRSSLTSEVFDPSTGAWSTTGPLNESRGGGHSATLLKDGRVLVAGGKGDAGSRDSLELFDPAARNGLGEWTIVARGFPREAHSATLLDSGKVLIAAGISDVGVDRKPTASAELFDPTEKDPGLALKATASLATARSEHGAVALAGGQAVVAGGTNLDDAGRDVSLAGLEVFDPTARQGRGGWVPGAPMGQGRGAPSKSFTLTRLPGDLWSDASACRPNCGKLLALGGPDPTANAFLTTAELYSQAPVVSAVVPGKGDMKGGTKVTLTGWGFKPGGTVLIGDQPAGVCGGEGCSTDTPTKLTRLTPAAGASPNRDVGIISAGTGFSVASQPFAYTGVPAVGSLALHPLSPRDMQLSFKSVSTAGGVGPPAANYVIKQSRLGISEDNFDQAKSLCESERGACAFHPLKGGDAIEFTISHLAPDTHYFYAVKALDEFGNLGPLSAVEGSTLAVLPGAVMNLTATAISANEAKLSFSASGVDEADPPPAGDYLIKQSRSPAMGDTEGFNGAESLCSGTCHFAPANVGDPLTITISGLSPSTAYHYAVRAVDAANNFGPISQVVGIITKAGGPPKQVSVPAKKSPAASVGGLGGRSLAVEAAKPVAPKEVASAPSKAPPPGQIPPLAAARSHKSRALPPPDETRSSSLRWVTLSSLGGVLFIGLMGLGRLLSRKLHPDGIARD